jgi:predicted methyltransferase
MRKAVVFALMGAALLPLAPLVAKAPVVSAVIAQAVSAPGRGPEERVADPLRKPAETMAFAGVRPGLTIGEFYPGGGYFTKMLSAAVGPKGHVYGIENDRWKQAVKANQDLVARGAYTNVAMDSGPFGTVRFPAPLDIAWVTQNYHDLKIAEYGVVDTAAFNRALYAALKPGGTYFILDHEAPKGTTVALIEKLHRIEKAQVIREVTAAGFRLVAEGTFLRHPQDDHTLSIFDKAIRGHTDQYALKFVKPVR